MSNKTHLLFYTLTALVCVSGKVDAKLIDAPPKNEKQVTVPGNTATGASAALTQQQVLPDLFAGLEEEGSTLGNTRTHQDLLRIMRGELTESEQDLLSMYGLTMDDVSNIASDLLNGEMDIPMPLYQAFINYFETLERDNRAVAAAEVPAPGTTLLILVGMLVIIGQLKSLPDATLTATLTEKTKLA
ncbi:hypothetical protein G8770_16800 [Aestuariicella hydrocarbonica]|uniref:Uncharacterized protein n=1 Tax=Pseudomaricurvus hydrocarbonicus TaxID=1470433 RepID=A0A9E5MMY0_9GAMM|nr:hypothetical protein [Aestuariicella hydrocarbonica]NHO67209.1 hypothetical protein [Aestuariicella hydrocarbonica]